MTSRSSLPLHGVSVLDLSDAALVQAGRLLADLGATVIRVEPSAGDEIRRRPPFVDHEPGLERSLRHLLYNGGKLSVAVDPSAPEAWDLIERLTDRVDIVLAPLAKSPAATAYFEASGFASRHPAVGLVDVVFRRDRPGLFGTDLMAVAAGGLLYCNGYPDRPPDYPIGYLAYKQASINAAAVAGALALNKTRNRGGGVVCISLEEAVMSTTIQAANQNLWRWYGAICRRAGMGGLSYPVLGADGQLAMLSGSGSTFEARDGRFVVFGMTPFTTERWDAFVAWADELIGDRSLQGEQWHDADLRSSHREQVHRVMTALCHRLDRDTLAYEGQRRGLMVVPVNRVEDIAADEHLIERGCFPAIRFPALARELPGLRSPFRSSAYDTITAPPPVLGAHTFEVLGQLGGLPLDELHRLRALGVIGGERPAGAQPPAWTAAETEGPRESPRKPTAPGTLPLAGYRVVDFCWQAAGPLMTELFANLGAEVIKLESATRVDTVRLFSHPAQHFSIDTGAFFNDCNTGKKSVTLNLSKPAGRELAQRLIRDADLVTSNFTAGQMEKWGFGYEQLRALRPGIIVASLPVMGSRGPKRSWRGIGNSVVAMSGIAAHTGFPENPPVGLGTLQTDFTVPLIGASAVIAALRHRERTGEGQYIEISQYESALHLLDTELLDFLVNGTSAPRRGNRSPYSSPHGVFPCRGDDRWVALEVRSTAEWLRLCEVIQRPDLAAREDLRSFGGRQAAEEEVEGAIGAWTKAHTPTEAESRLQSAGLPASALKNVADLVEDTPGLREFFTTVDHPAGTSVSLQNQPFTWNGARLGISRAPLLGEHNTEVLRDGLGLGEETFVDLLVGEVII